MFGPGVWIRAVQAMKKGYYPGRTVGNPWLLPGVFLMREGKVLLSWQYRNIGDQPDFSAIPAFSNAIAGLITFWASLGKSERFSMWRLAEAPDVGKLIASPP